MDYGCNCTTADGDFCTASDSGSQSAATRSASFDIFSLSAVACFVSAVLASERHPREGRRIARH